jgi:hypothetical protein
VNARLKRASRLEGLADRALTAARGRVADARRALVAATEAAETAEATWILATQAFATRVESAADLVEQAAHVRTLRLRADAAAKRLAEAAAEEKHRAELVLEAERDRRKLELWRERLTETEREQGARAERLAADELAARTARGRT